MSDWASYGTGMHNIDGILLELSCCWKVIGSLSWCENVQLFFGERVLCTAHGHSFTRLFIV